MAYTIQASGIVRQLTGVALGSGGYPGVALHEWTDASGVGAEVAGTTISSSAQGAWSVSTTGGDTTKKYVVKLWNREDVTQVRYVPITESHTFQSIRIGSGSILSQSTVLASRISVATAGSSAGFINLRSNGIIGFDNDADGLDEITISATGGSDVVTLDKDFAVRNLSVASVATAAGLSVSTVATAAGLVVTGVATVGTLAATSAISLPTGSVTTSMIANRTRSFLVQPIAFSGPGGFFSIGASYALPMAENSEVIVRGWFLTPSDYSSNLNVGAMVESVETGTAYAKMDAIFGAEEESIPEGTSPNHSVTTNWTSVPIVATSITNICQLTLSSVSVGDVVCVTFDRNGSGVNNVNISTLGFYGFIVNYTADS